MLSVEEKELYDAYKAECDACWEVAQWLDTTDPAVPHAFAGTPSQRILRQVKRLISSLESRNEENRLLKDALKQMLEEFRQLDLPYGSEAYTNATDVINKVSKR